jgi:hypothetical protein
MEPGYFSVIRGFFVTNGPKSNFADIFWPVFALYSLLRAVGMRRAAPNVQKAATKVAAF